MNKVNVLDHPLLQHKISLMRDKNLGTKEFRELTAEVATLMTYEVTRDLPLKVVEIETPVSIATTKVISGRKVAFVPILRAGLGMVDGAISLVPAAKVGHVGICRESRFSEGERGFGDSSVKYHGDGMLEYYCKLPFDINKREVIVMDLMLATGRSATHAISEIKEAGCTTIKFMTVIACPEGIAKLNAEHPDVEIYCGALDDGIDEDGYITPGFGDGGDRIFGTK